MYNNLVPTLHNIFLVKRNLFIFIPMCLSFAINIIAYYLLISRFKDVITKTGPRLIQVPYLQIDVTWTWHKQKTQKIIVLWQDAKWWVRDDDVPVGFGATVLGSTTVSDTIIKKLFCITIFHYCTDDFLALFSMSMILGRSFGRAQRWVGQSGWRLFLLRSRGRSLYSRRRDCKLFSWNYILKKLVGL